MVSCTPRGRSRTLVPVGSARSFRRHRSHMDEWTRTGCRPASVARRAPAPAAARSVMRHYFVFRSMKTDQSRPGTNREVEEKFLTRMLTFVPLPEGGSGGDVIQDRLIYCFCMTRAETRKTRVELLRRLVTDLNPIELARADDSQRHR